MKVSSAARVVAAVRSPRAPAAHKVAAAHRAAAEPLVVVQLAVAQQVAEPLVVQLAVVAPRAVEARPVACLTLVAVPLAVVRAVFPLQAVAVVVAAAVE